MTLELSRLTDQVQVMGEALAARERRYADLVTLARQWLARYADQGETLRGPARAIGAAIPTDEPLDAHYPLPAVPEQFTVVAADGSEIQPDRHSVALYSLINVGSLVYRHGSGERPEARSEPTLGYTEDDLYENGMLVAGNLLDTRRDLAELTCLADVCAAERGSPTAALVDGSIVLWVLKDLSAGSRQRKVAAYLEQLERICGAGAALSGFISRPRYGEVTRLLHLASLEGDSEQAGEKPNPFEHLPDRAVFRSLSPGARSALFVSPSRVNHDYYRPAGHTVHFCYVNLVVGERPSQGAEERQEPIIARLEVPAWVAEQPDRMALLHGAVVAQARITGDYPYALARADELAYISSQERTAFEELVTTTLLQVGVRSALSPKAYYKSLTRWGG